MGIKSLHRLLEKYAPNCYRHVHLSQYAYKKIAIDISLYLYKYKAIHGNRWLECFLTLITCLRKWDVHCIFIYDGKAPVEKVEEQLRRRESRAKLNIKIQDIEKEIADFEETGTIGTLIEEIHKKEGGVVSLFRKNVPNINIELVKTKVEAMKNMMIHITPEDISLSKNLFDVLHIPYVEAPNEAERYAAQLCVDGKIDGVLSEDTDVLVYGTPIFLTKIDTNNETVIEITHAVIREEMDMTTETFRDLCIMCSCDYNSNIPSIGPEKSYQLLREHHTIENVIDELKKPSYHFTQHGQKHPYTDEVCAILKHEVCRTLFSTYPIEYYIPYCGMPDFNALQEFLRIHSIRYDITSLKKHLCPREPVFEDEANE
jgi:5'-3' exonuclease